MPSTAKPMAAIDNADGIYRLSPTQLPVNPVIKHQALNKIRSVTANANNVANIIRQDPVLSLRLFHHTLQALKADADKDNEPHELSHSISLLGFPVVESLIADSPELNGDTQYVSEYLQQIAISLHAAVQVEGWADKHRHWPASEVYWPCLFHYSPLWALWHSEGGKMQQLQYARAKCRGVSALKIEQALFGQSLAKLCATLGKTWRLPHLSQRCWQDEQIHRAKLWVDLSRIADQTNTPSRLQGLCANPGFAIALANRFAAETDWNWYSKHTLRLQKVLANAIDTTSEQAIALTHQLAATASRRYKDQHIQTSATQLLGYYNKSQLYLSEHQPQTEHRVPSTLQQRLSHTRPQSSAPVNEQAAFTQIVNRLAHQHDSFSNLPDMMNLAVNALCQHTPIERATVSLLNLKRKEIRTVYSSGCSDSPALKHYSHTLQRGDLLNKLMQKSVSVRLQPDNYKKIWPLIPKSLQQACGTDEFFMMSLFAGKRPIALLYADCGISHRALTDDQYQQFKQLCQAVCSCLTKLHSSI